MPTYQPPPHDLIALLLAQGLIDDAGAARLNTRVEDTWIPLGKILRQQNLVSMGELIDILQMQDVEPLVPLGEIAVREGYCSAADVERALKLQLELSPNVIEILLREEHCDPLRLCTALALYVRQLEQRLREYQPERERAVTGGSSF